MGSTIAAYRAQDAKDAARRHYAELLRFPSQEEFTGLTPDQANHAVREWTSARPPAMRKILEYRLQARIVSMTEQLRTIKPEALAEHQLRIQALQDALAFVLNPPKENAPAPEQEPTP